jgi:hypothetical protein
MSWPRRCPNRVGVSWTGSDATETTIGCHFQVGLKAETHEQASKHVGQAIGETPGTNFMREAEQAVLYVPYVCTRPGSD